MNEELLEITLDSGFINYTQFLFIKNMLKNKDINVLTLLVENDYINVQQKEIIIKSYLDQNQFSKQDIRFGALAHKLFNVPLTDIKNGLNYQKQIKKFIPLRLGEILVLHGKLTASEVMKILEFQESRIVNCKCGTSYNFIKFNSGKKIKCYRCRDELLIP
ncbi:MAG: hypothetical protein ACK4NF_01940 [Planctomycetota bacterium]